MASGSGKTGAGSSMANTEKRLILSIVTEINYFIFK
jgi:hypothetical protein